MDATPEHIAELIRQGRKIEAIRILQEESGVGLATAREAVERIAHAHDAPTADAAALPAGMPDDVAALARSGNHIVAIKRYRDRTGVPLAEARDAVLRAAGIPPTQAAANQRAAAVVLFVVALVFVGLGAVLVLVLAA